MTRAAIWTRICILRNASTHRNSSVARRAKYNIWRGWSILNARDTMTHLLATLTVLDLRKLWAACRLIVFKGCVSPESPLHPAGTSQSCENPCWENKNEGGIYVKGYLLVCPYVISEFLVCPTHARTHVLKISFIYSYNNMKVRKTNNKYILLWFVRM